MSSRLKAVSALLAAMVLVGSSVAVGRTMTAALPLYFASLARFALASLVLVPLVVLVEGRFPRVSRRTGGALFAQAVCGSFLFTACLLSGLALTGAAQAGVIAAATPAAVAILGRLLFRERLGKAALAGIACTTCGIAILGTEPGVAAVGPSPVLGNLLVLCAVGFEAVFLLLRRTVREPLSPLAAATWVSLLGCLLFLGPGLWQGWQLSPHDITLKSAGEVVYYALGVTAAAYMLWFYGVVRVDAATAGVATGMMPVAALAFAALWCGETVGWREMAGCAGVLAGILCLSLGGKAKTSAATEQSRGRAL
ncbi:Permease of the drug/metabolite transporter (DMT) superfamily [Desulfovibrio sp. DV]|uniref:DMT family transporter n=1 Tax=Desulfovibrio sp. DV TaxID=1844708 RepID=UPI00094BC033|nr:DMT family transporter [Desulfovibrio sp. DV]OLN27672.1 Permease of the drug/metabolite transporter (DMT) superfamily [Desulfovibrio sp. DV]